MHTGFFFFSSRICKWIQVPVQGWIFPVLIDFNFHKNIRNLYKSDAFGREKFSVYFILKGICVYCKNKSPLTQKQWINRVCLLSYYWCVSFIWAHQHQVQHLMALVWVEVLEALASVFLRWLDTAAIIPVLDMVMEVAIHYMAILTADDIDIRTSIHRLQF